MLHTLTQKATAQALSIEAAGGVVLLLAVLVLPKEGGGGGHRGPVGV